MKRHRSTEAAGFTPAMTALVAEQPYRFVVTNMDTVRHPFLLEPADASDLPLAVGDVQANVDGIAPGQTASLVWTFPQPGNVQMADDRTTQATPGFATAVTVVPADTPTLAVTLGDFTVTPEATQLTAGKLSLFEVTNPGAATHEFVLEEAGAVDEPLATVANGAKME